MAALDVDNGSGMIVLLVLLVMFLFALCALRLTGPRCLASWPVWTRRTVFLDHGALIVDSGSGMCRAGFTGYAPRAVFFLAVRPRCRASWSSWTDLFVARLRNDRAHGPGSADSRARAVLEQGGDSDVAPVELHRCISWTMLLSFRQCRGPDSENCLEVLQLLFIEGRRHPVFTQRLIPMVLVVQMTIEIPQFVDTVVGFPCCAGRAGSQVPLWRGHSCSHSCSSLRKSSPAENCSFRSCSFMVVRIPVVARRKFPMVLRTMAFPQHRRPCFYRWCGFHRCRRGEDSRGEELME